MTGTRIDNKHSKSDRALELFEKGIDTATIAARIGCSPRSVWTLCRNARIKREREIERAGRLADILGANV
jgi:hypothetical protein